MGPSGGLPSGSEPREAVEARQLAAADLTAEYPVEPTPGGGTRAVGSG